MRTLANRELCFNKSAIFIIYNPSIFDCLSFLFWIELFCTCDYLTCYSYEKVSIFNNPSDIKQYPSKPNLVRITPYFLFKIGFFTRYIGYIENIRSNETAMNEGNQVRTQDFEKGVAGAKRILLIGST